jgi:hypothetical protein
VLLYPAISCYILLYPAISCYILLYTTGRGLAWVRARKWLKHVTALPYSCGSVRPAGQCGLRVSAACGSVPLKALACSSQAPRHAPFISTPLPLQPRHLKSRPYKSHPSSHVPFRPRPVSSTARPLQTIYPRLPRRCCGPSTASTLLPPHAAVRWRTLAIYQAIAYIKP